MAARKKKRKPARRKRRSNNGGSFGSMLVGLVAGLSIAAVIWYFQSTDRSPTTATLPDTAAKAEPVRKAPKDVESAPIEATGSGYDFYDMLPAQEVIVSDDFAARREPAASATPPADAPVVESGAYIIQAGSFRSAVDADSVKARLAILGMNPRVEVVEIKDRVFHRVRIGPLDDVSRVNEFRRRLRAEKIDVQVIQIKG